MNPLKIIISLIVALLAVILTACDTPDGDPTQGDVHRQGKVPDGGMGPASGGN